MGRSSSRLLLVAILLWPVCATAADPQVVKKYFAHPAVEDRDGVIAPWYRGQNGQCDFRVRDRGRDAQALSLGRQGRGRHGGAAFRLHRNVGIKPDGTILVSPKLDNWMFADVGQRSVSTLFGNDPIIATRAIRRPSG